MAAFTALKPHLRDVGGFSVRRVLPAFPYKMVGPFIFFDHIGPVQFGSGQGLDVRPHPHIGLATVTYLFEGTILHRDTLGTVQPIHPGDVNWMTAGQGIAHSERTPEELHRSGSVLHGIQTWVALPKQHESVPPAFEHHPASVLPTIEMPGIAMRIIAGSAFGKTAPTTTFSRMFYVSVEMEAGSSLTVPPEHEERAVYLVEGNVTVAGEPLELYCMAVLQPGQDVAIEAQTKVRMMLLGGEPMDGDRFIWWNFVASSREAIEDAKQQWREQRFGSIPGETEWIPLPGEEKPAESFS